MFLHIRTSIALISLYSVFLIWVLLRGKLLHRLDPKKSQALEDRSNAVNEKSQKVAEDAAKKLQDLEDALTRAKQNKV